MLHFFFFFLTSVEGLFLAHRVRVYLLYDRVLQSMCVWVSEGEGWLFSRGLQPACGEGGFLGRGGGRGRREKRLQGFRQKGDGSSQRYGAFFIFICVPFGSTQLQLGIIVFCNLQTTCRLDVLY